MLLIDRHNFKVSHKLEDELLRITVEVDWNPETANKTQDVAAAYQKKTQSEKAANRYKRGGG